MRVEQRKSRPVLVEALEGRQLMSTTYYFKATSTTTIGEWINSLPAGNPNTTIQDSQSLILTATDPSGSSVTIDETTGQAYPTGGLTVNFNGANTNNSILLIGTANGSDTLKSNGTSFFFDSTTSSVSVNTTTKFYFNPYSNGDAVTITGGGMIFPSGASGGGIVQRKLSYLNIASGASVDAAIPPTFTDRQVLDVPNSGFIINGQLDLTENDMEVTGGSYNGIIGNFKLGSGLTTSSTSIATSAGTAATTLDIAAVPGGEGPYASFDGIPWTGAAVTIGWTYYGDTDLSGFIDSKDTSNFSAKAGWNDFNYDGQVNSTDLALLNASIKNEGTTHLR